MKTTEHNNAYDKKLEELKEMYDNHDRLTIYDIDSEEELQEVIMGFIKNNQSYMERLKNDKADIRVISIILDIENTNMLRILENTTNDNLDDMIRLFTVNHAAHLRYANPSFVLREPENIVSVISATEDFTISKIKEANNKNSEKNNAF